MNLDLPFFFFFFFFFKFFLREAEPPGEVGDSQEGSAGGGAGRFASLPASGVGGHREGVGGVPRGGERGGE